MRRRIRIKLDAFIMAQRIEYYGEGGVFIPFRYNTTEKSRQDAFASLKILTAGMSLTDLRKSMRSPTAKGLLI